MGTSAQTISLPRGVISRIRLHPPLLVVLCVVWLAVIVVLTVAGGLVAPHPASQQDVVLGLSGPGPGHLLGTDELGRDILSRIVAGADTAIMGPAVMALATMIISAAIGIGAGYLRGWFEIVAMRLSDLLLAFPAMLLLVVIASVFGGGYWVAVAIMVVLVVPGDVRMIRGATLEQCPRAYVEAAEVLGLSRRRIMFSHLLPNVLPILLVNLALDFTIALVALASLSFLGIGVPPGDPDWGRMLEENRGDLYTNPWAAIGPAIAIVFTAASANVVGDWLYDRFSARGRAR